MRANGFHLWFLIGFVGHVLFVIAKEIYPPKLPEPGTLPPEKRLALEIALRMAQEHPWRVYFMTLAVALVLGPFEFLYVAKHVYRKGEWG